MSLLYSDYHVKCRIETRHHLSDNGLWSLFKFTVQQEINWKDSGVLNSAHRLNPWNLGWNQMLTDVTAILPASTEAPSSSPSQWLISPITWLPSLGTAGHFAGIPNQLNVWWVKQQPRHLTLSQVPKNIQSRFLLNNYIYLLCVYKHVCRCSNAMHTCGGQRTTCKNSLCPSTMQVLGLNPGCQAWQQAPSLTEPALPSIFQSSLEKEQQTCCCKTKQYIMISLYNKVCTTNRNMFENRLFGSGWGSHTCSTSIWDSNDQLLEASLGCSVRPHLKIRIIERGKPAFG